MSFKNEQLPKEFRGLMNGYFDVAGAKRDELSMYYNAETFNYGFMNEPVVSSMKNFFRAIKKAI